MTDWSKVHEKVVEEFRAGWDHPGSHAWDGFLGERMRFVQPLLRDVTGAEPWREESARLLMLVPDLRADVLAWAGSEEKLFIHLRFHATLDGRPLTWDAIDLLHVEPDGTAVFRESFFDSVPVAAQVIRRPRAWLRWWRSGVGPLLARRRLLAAVPQTEVSARPGDGVQR